MRLLQTCRELRNRKAANSNLVPLVQCYHNDRYHILFQTYGGNHWPVRLYRGLFEARSMLANMWRGNPVLTALVFGLPLGFLSLICYSVCCADILDAEEDETPGNPLLSFALGQTRVARS